MWCVCITAEELMRWCDFFPSNGWPPVATSLSSSFLFFTLTSDGSVATTMVYVRRWLFGVVLSYKCCHRPSSLSVCILQLKSYLNLPTRWAPNRGKRLLRLNLWVHDKSIAAAVARFPTFYLVMTQDCDNLIRKLLLGASGENMVRSDDKRLVWGNSRSPPITYNTI